MDELPLEVFNNLKLSTGQRCSKKIEDNVYGSLTMSGFFVKNLVKNFSYEELLLENHFFRKIYIFIKNSNFCQKN